MQILVYFTKIVHNHIQEETKLKCKGICYRFAAKKPIGGYRFAIGQRPCSVCGIFVDSLVLGVRCPCCNNKLRLTSRNARSRKNRFAIADKFIQNASDIIKSLNSKNIESEPLITSKLVLNKQKRY